MKTRADELALLGVSMDDDDLTKKILDGLGSEYKNLVHVVHARDTPITFNDLHEKLLTFEAHLQETKLDQSYLPASANPAQCTNTGSHTSGWRPSSTNTPPPPFGSTNTGWHPSSTNNWRPSPDPNQPRGNRQPPRPYLGYCQICGIHGHTTKRCPSFRIVPNDLSSSPRPLITRSTAPWQPRAHFAVTPTSAIPSWLFDSGASHHVTVDLSNLSLHAPYTGTDDVMVGDGTGLPITHTGSTSLNTPTTSFTLSNVLCVPSMKKNLISISQFCITNNVSIEFLPTSFLVKELRTRVILLTGQTKDEVYEWLVSSSVQSPLLVFSSVKTTSSEWHHRLGHPAFTILKHVTSHYKLDLVSSISPNFSCNA